MQKPCPILDLLQLPMRTFCSLVVNLDKVDSKYKINLLGKYGSPRESQWLMYVLLLLMGESAKKIVSLYPIPMNLTTKNLLQDYAYINSRKRPCHCKVH